MALFSKLPSWASILITVIAAVIVVGLVSWGINTLVEPGPSKLPEGEEKVEKINFSETGNLMINNPGFEPNQWYLSYEKPGAAGLSVALSFDKKSICIEGRVKEVCQVSKLSSGDRVTIKGIKSNGNVLVRELIKQNETANWKTYRNEEYGFEVKIPVQWSGYKVTKRISDVIPVPHFYFLLPTKEEGWSGYADLFAISIYTKKQFEEGNKENAEPGTQIGGITIGQNDQYVAVASYSQVEPPKDLKSASALTENIISTFKFIK